VSIQAMSWVLDHSTTEGAERLVLIALANHAGQSPVDGAWESYPGVTTIQREANLRRERTVQEVLARLVQGGHVERILNGAPDDRIRKDRRPNLYRILVAVGTGFSTGPETAPRGAAERQGVSTERGDAPRQAVGGSRDDAARHPVAPNGVPSDDTTGCRLTSSRGAVSRHNGVPSDGTQTVIEPSVEPSVEPKTVIAVPATAPTLALVRRPSPMTEPVPPEPYGSVIQTTWDLFWQRYPRKTHKQEARQAWKALIANGVRDTDVIAGLDRWLAHWQTSGTGQEHIRYPARWLSSREWAENPPPLPNRAPKGQQRTNELHDVISNFLAKEDSA
jgi:hypothetical protein